MVRAIAELARAHGLTLLAEQLTGFPPNQSLRAAGAGPEASPPPIVEGEPDHLLRMIRHGAQPESVAQLLESLDGRPVEQGLAAWDVLCTSRVGDRMKHALRDTLAPLRPVLPLDGSQGLAFEALPVLMPQLAALDRFSDEELLKRGLAFHFAHLETLASLYFLYVYGARAEDNGLIALCEVLLECDAHERLPDGLEARLADETPRYVSARAAALAGGARAWLDARKAAPDFVDFYAVRNEQVARTEPRLRMAEAELGMAAGQLPFMYQVVDLISASEPSWRYGARIHAAMHLKSRDAIAPALVDAFLSRFGNDARLWRAAHAGLSFGDPLWRKLAMQALRETQAHPHDAAAWSGLIALTCPDWQPATAQLTASLRAQCALPASVVA